MKLIPILTVDQKLIHFNPDFLVAITTDNKITTIHLLNHPPYMVSQTPGEIIDMIKNTKPVF